MKTPDPIKCCICGHNIQPVGDWRHGHNAEPVADGRCCDECNSLVVIPARIAQMTKRKKKMTFEEWIATERVSDSVENAENYFGYVPEGAAEILEYSPGAIVRLADGFYFTHIYRDEYTGSLQEVREILWREYASREVQ